MPKENNFSLTNKTKGKLPRLPFEQMKKEVLGEDYKLSLVFIGNKTSQKLNKQYRNIDKATNILSFSLTDNEGEIFINLKTAEKEAEKFYRDMNNFLCFLFIHGLTHLKGFSHGSKMDSEEIKVRKKFGI